MGETPGAGQVMKLANNLLSLAAIATTAEAMTLGIKAGLDPARMIEVLNAGTGDQFGDARQVAPRRPAAHVRFRLLRPAQPEGHPPRARRGAAMGVPLPTGERLASLLDRTLATYGDDADFTEMAKVVEEDAGIDPQR